MPKILIADDSGTIRCFLEDLATEWGYEPLLVQNGREALEVFQEPDPPRIALIDWLMPVLDGLTVCRTLKQAKNLPFIYVILITSKDKKADIVQGLDAGADDFISKTVGPEELRSRLELGLRISGYQDELADRNEKLEALLSALPDAICLKDAEGRWVKANDPCKRLFQFHGRHYKGEKSRELVAGLTTSVKNLLLNIEQLDEKAYQTQKIIHEEFEVNTEEGRKTYEIIKVPLFHKNGERRGIIDIGRDITCQKELL